MYLNSRKSSKYIASVGRENREKNADVNEEERERENGRIEFPTKTIPLPSRAASPARTVSHPPLSSPHPVHFRFPVASHRDGDALIDTNASRITRRDERTSEPRILEQNVCAAFCVCTVEP